MKAGAVFFFAAIAPLLALERPGHQRPSLWPKPLAQSTARIVVDRPPFINNPSAGGISVDGIGEPLRFGNMLTLTFPTAMVPPDKIDSTGIQSPIEVWPSLDLEMTWRTQSQGELIVKSSLTPGQTYQFRLREGTKDLAGQALPEAVWGFEMTTPSL
ncbi:MAG TPA: hypothetical protein VIS99_07990, partial [Terrimicrobiaceae bacterium]